MTPDRSDMDDEALLARARSRARSAWSASLREDDRVRRAGSEQRLAASWPRPRVLPVRSFALGAAFATCVAVVLVLARGSSSLSWSAKPPVASTSGATPAPPAMVVPPATTTTAQAATTAAASRDVHDLRDVPDGREARGMIVTGACPDCRVGGVAIEPGLTVGVGQALSVPRGSRVTLGFAVAGQALVDPATGIDVEGPALATASAGEEQTLQLDRGSARFRGLADIAIVLPGGRVESKGATFTVRVDGQGVATVAVEKGRVVLTSTGARATSSAETIEAGASRVIAGPIASPATGSAAALAPASPALEAARANAAGSASASAAGADLDAVSSARAKFLDGDVATARRQLEVLAHAADATVARRATFTLAEIEMASGDRERGRARLFELTTCPDVRLASDAATLLARSEPTAAARADAWARYLATSPPPAYRDRALLERAEALLDARRTSEANGILAELRDAPLSDAQKRQLERLVFKSRELR